MTERAVAYTKINGKVFDDEGEHKDLGGSNFSAFNEAVMQQALQSQWLGTADDEKRTDRIHATIGALKGINPRDEVEGMLAAQMVATHNAAMECFRRAMIPDQPHMGRDNNLGHAGKLVRSYAVLLQALDKHRGKGQQTVRVEHVHVHNGGQAIVGQVGGQMPSLANEPTQSINLLGEDHSLAEMALAVTKEGGSK